MKLTKILESILSELNIPKPEDAYKFDRIASKNLGYGDYYKYAYTNVKGDPMEVTVISQKNPKYPGLTFYVAFGPDETAQGTKTDFIPDLDNEDPDDEEKKYNIKTGAGDVLKVLATVVQAVKNTANKVGGMDKVYAMAWSPADKKRKNVYDYYVQTLFPNFKKDLAASSSSFQHYINQDFKGKELTEIGDASKQPYPFKLVIDDIYEREYIFSTDSGFQYEVEVETIEGDPMEPVIARVGFGVIDDTDEVSYVKQTGENDVYRIMSTITSIVKKDLRSNSADFIEFSPSKRQVKDIDQDPMANVRTQLYSRYIKSQFPNSEVQVDDYGDIRVNLNN